MNVTPAQRLLRMRRLFAKDKSVLVEDYKHFITPDAPNPPSTTERTSAALHVPRAPRRS